MFTELLSFCLTLVGLFFLDKVNFLIGIIVLSILIYMCVTRYMRDLSRHESDEISYFETYIDKVSNFFHLLLTTYDWRSYVNNIRKIWYLVKAVSGNENQQSNSAIASENTSHYCTANASIDKEIKTIVECIMREYINSWYHGKISDNKKFTNNIELIIQDTFVAFSDCIIRCDKEQLASHILQIYHHYFFHFKDSLKKVAEDNFLEACIMHKEKLHENFEMHHWALKSELTEWSYLESIIGTLIDSFGPAELLSCSLLHTAVIEILTQNVMHPLINVFTDSNRLNIWLAKLLQNVFKVNSEVFLNKEKEENVSTEIQDNREPLPTSTSSVLSPTIVLSQDFLQEPEYTNDSNEFLTSHISDNDTSSNISLPASDISADKVSNISNGSMQSDKSIRSSFKEKNVKFNPISLFSPLFRARSISISNKSADMNESNLQSRPQLLQVSQMKRSHSADFIRQMNETNNLLPLNLSSHSIRYCEKTKRNFLKVKLESSSHSTGEIEVAEEAMEKEVPPLFSDVKIVDTQQQMDTGHNPYTLYCIQYMGVFENLSSESHYPDLVQQQVCIKRRFREFLALQSRLEDDPSVKILLKGIKGPSKWLATPFGNLDKKNIADRKLFLDSYLQELCKYDAIVRSSVLQEFLAYGGDASIAFVKKTTDITVPRFDKFIFKSVRGAIDFFRTALPNSNDAGFSREPSQSPETSVEDTSFETKFPIFLYEYIKKAPEMSMLVNSFLEQFDIYSPDHSDCDDFLLKDAKKSPRRCASLLQHSDFISTPEECNCFVTSSWIDADKENALALLSVDFIAELFPKMYLPYLLKFLPISLLQSLLETEIEVSEKRIIHFLHIFHKSLWPDVKAIQYHWHSNMASIVHKELLRQLEGFTSQNTFLKVLNYIVGTDSLSEAIELFVGSIQNEKMNRCLLFYVFDAVIQAMDPKEN